MDSAPGLAIGAAFSPDGALWVVGVAAPGALFLQTSDDLGAHWSPRRLLPVADDTPAADGESRPKIAFGPDGRVTISYTQPLAKPYTGAIRMLRSSDGGATFSAPFTVHRDRQVITHRFDEVAFDRAGTLHTLWIDKRDLATAPRGDYRGAAVYRNESHDGGASFGPDIKLADHSCECCRIALAPTADGGIAALWRAVFAPGIRDHAFAVVGRGVPVRASFDGWHLDACPHHGPGLASAEDGGFHAVWFGERDGRMAVRYGRLAADGTPRGGVRELPDPRAEHADVAAIGRRVAIVWRSFDGTRTHLRVWVSADGGEEFVQHKLGDSTEAPDQPHLLVSGSRMFAVWRDEREIRVVPIPD